MALKQLSTAEKADKGIDIEIFHPSTGESLGIVVTMLGSDSAAYIEADRKIRSRQLQRAKRKRDFTIGMEPEEVEASLVERLSACFVGWKERLADGSFKNTLNFDEGVELPSTRAEFTKIISDRGYYWFRAQVQEGMDTVSNFLPSSATPSVPPQPSVSAMTPRNGAE